MLETKHREWRSTDECCHQIKYKACWTKPCGENTSGAKKRVVTPISWQVCCHASKRQIISGGGLWHLFWWSLLFLLPGWGHFSWQLGCDANAFIKNVPCFLTSMPSIHTHARHVYTHTHAQRGKKQRRLDTKDKRGHELSRLFFSWHTHTHVCSPVTPSWPLPRW